MFGKFNVWRVQCLVSSVSDKFSIFKVHKPAEYFKEIARNFTCINSSYSTTLAWNPSYLIYNKIWFWIAKNDIYIRISRRIRIRIRNNIRFETGTRVRPTEEKTEVENLMTLTVLLSNVWFYFPCKEWHTVIFPFFDLKEVDLLLSFMLLHANRILN
jgi:hypothetical protein